MRITHIRTGLLAILLLVATVLASNAQTSGTGGASPQAPPQSPQQAPSSQSGQAGSASQSSQSADDNPLGLTDEQKAKLRPIITDENQQMEAVRNDSSLSMEQKVA